MRANLPKPVKSPPAAGRSSNLVVDDLRTAILGDCNASRLPVTVVHLILTDLCNAYAAAERDQLVRERAAESARDKPAAGTAPAQTPEPGKEDADAG